MEQLKKDFLRFAKHQLKSPLTLIKGYLSFMQSGDFQKFSNTKQKEIIAKMATASKKLNLLINDVFLLLQIKEGLKINPEPIQLKELIGESAPELIIDSDRFYLTIVLQKLLSMDDPGQTDINIHKENNYAIIEIREIWSDDTGLGLDVIKGIIKTLGGEISAESAGQNKRTKFIIKLPI